MSPKPKKVLAAEPTWKQEPDNHDYPAAVTYLSLVLPTRLAEGAVEALKAAPIAHYKAKDLLRASALALLPAENAHVAVDLAKVGRGEALSPVLVIRGRLPDAVPATIADGYHRICASYHIDENADIPCRIADFDLVQNTRPPIPPSTGKTDSDKTDPGDL